MQPDPTYPCDMPVPVQALYVKEPLLGLHQPPPDDARQHALQSPFKARQLPCNAQTQGPHTDVQLRGGREAAAVGSGAGAVRQATCCNVISSWLQSWSLDSQHSA